MYCPNCRRALKPVNEVLSKDLLNGDYFTHYCSGCTTYWHLHIHGDSQVVLIATTGEQVASNKIINDLKFELSEYLLRLER